MAPRDLASRLRDMVDIEEQNLVDNGRGGRTTPAGQSKWKPVDQSVPAEIIALRGNEATEHAVIRARQLWRITLRVRSDVRPSMRVAWDDAALGRVIGDIKAAALNDARDALVMTVESGGPA